jgi:hypothetical protein
MALFTKENMKRGILPCGLIVLMYKAAPLMEPIKLKLPALLIIGTARGFQERTLLPLVLHVLVSAHGVALLFGNSSFL